MLLIHHKKYANSMAGGKELVFQHLAEFKEPCFNNLITSSKDIILSLTK